MGYSFKVDASSPSLLSPGIRIFNVSKEHVGLLGKYIRVAEDSSAYRSTVYSSSSSTISKHIATNYGVKNFYGAFSVAASMSLDSTKKQEVHTVRLDAFALFIQSIVSSNGAFVLSPDKFLSDDFKKTVVDLSCEDIEEKIGVFYATEIKLGGKVTKTYLMEASSDDDERTVRAEIEALYGKELFGVAGEAGMSMTTRKNNKKAQMKTEWLAQGGETAVWLGVDFKKDGAVGSTLDKWVATFKKDGTNSSPMEFKLQPLWTLIHYVDKYKAHEFERYLKAKWNKNISSWSPSKFIERGYTWWCWSSECCSCRYRFCMETNAGPVNMYKKWSSLEESKYGPDLTTITTTLTM